MANVRLSGPMIADEALRLLVHRVGGCGEMYYEPSFASSGARVGCVVNLVREGPVNVYDLAKGNGGSNSGLFAVSYQACALDKQFSAESRCAGIDYLKTIDGFSRTVLRPAIEGLAKTILGAWPLGADYITADLEIPFGVDMAARGADPRSNLALRVVNAYDVVNDVWRFRVDVLCGFAQEPEILPVTRLHRLAAFKAEVQASLDQLRARRPAGL